MKRLLSLLLCVVMLLSIIPMAAMAETVSTDAAETDVDGENAPVEEVSSTESKLVLAIFAIFILAFCFVVGKLKK